MPMKAKSLKSYLLRIQTRKLYYNLNVINMVNVMKKEKKHQIYKKKDQKQKSICNASDSTAVI